MLIRGKKNQVLTFLLLGVLLFSVFTPIFTYPNRKEETNTKEELSEKYVSSLSEGNIDEDSPVIVQRDLTDALEQLFSSLTFANNITLNEEETIHVETSQQCAMSEASPGDSIPVPSGGDIPVPGYPGIDGLGYLPVY